jgi:cytochrome d ubiquinol oxidase subunit II
MLPLIWYVLIGVLFVGYAVLDGFDLGTGVLYPFLGKTEEDKAVMRTSIGPVWDGNEVWLLTGGGALFAAFPPVYATVFSGFYLALMLVLFGLIFRALSIEYRSHDPKWATFWDWSFFVGSLLPALLFGVAVGNLVRGIPLNRIGDFTGGFFSLLNPFSLLLGILGLAYFMWHGANWISLKSEGELHDRASRTGDTLWLVYGVAIVLAGAATAILEPRAFRAITGRPLGWVFVVVLLGSLLWARVAKADRIKFYGSALSAVGLIGLWAMATFPFMVYSTVQPGKLSLTYLNSSSSDLTLTVMLIIALIGVPLVLFYHFLVYRTFAGKVKLGAEDSY